MDWNDHRKRTKRNECLICFLIFVLVLIGSACDYLVGKGTAFHYVENLADFSLTILQIQATITTLTISIIALLSGSISKSYMGVSVSGFYLEKRPCILTQLVIIIMEFVFLALSVAVYLFDCYNLVLCLFASSIVLILYAISEIYREFVAGRKTEREIQSYVAYLFKEVKDYDNNVHVYIKDWETILPTQSKESYERYFDLFRILIERILCNEKRISDINSYAEELSMFLLQHEYEGCRIKGIRFVSDFYDMILDWIRMDKNQTYGFDEPISLIDRVAYSWILAMDSIDAEVIEKNLDFNVFSETVIGVASWRGFPHGQGSNDVTGIKNISKALGGYIAKQQKKGNFINTGYWGNLLTHGISSGFWGLPKDSSDYYFEAMAQKDFCICYGYMLNGQTDLILNGLFLDYLNKVQRIENQAEVLKMMLIHCYMFYLSFKEHTDCIDADLQKKLSQLILDKRVTEAIYGFYDDLDNGKWLLDEQLENRLEGILIGYELLPKHYNTKYAMTNNVAKEYFLYVALMICRQDALVGILSTRLYSYYLTEAGNRKLRESIAEKHKIFYGVNISEEKALSKTNAMISAFESVMIEKTKRMVLNDATKIQQEYEKQGLKIETIKQIKKMVKDSFENLFPKVRDPLKVEESYEKVHVFGFPKFTQWINWDIPNNYSDPSMGVFTSWFVDKMIEDFGLKIIFREDFSSDSDFRVYLKNERFDNLLGPSFVFRSVEQEDYLKYMAHSTFLNDLKCGFVSMAKIDTGIAFRDGTLSVGLDDIYVEISSPEINDMGVTADEETGLYSYESVIGVVLDFEEAELRKYLHDVWKKVDIYVDVTIGFDDDEGQPNGVAVKRKPPVNE